jgi:succinyl-CoA:acetate CoA-transferase
MEGRYDSPLKSKRGEDAVDRVCEAAKNKMMSAEQAASMIQTGMTLATSGFGGVGYPKVIPEALAASGHARDLTLYSSAACGDMLDGCLARAGLVTRRSPYQSVKEMRSAINQGGVQYIDLHLSKLPMFVKEELGEHLDVAIIECAAVTENGLVPTMMIGCCDTYARMADRVIVELNETVPAEIFGIHDVFENPKLPWTAPIPLCDVGDRLGSPYIPCPLEKIAAIVRSDREDELTLKPTGGIYEKIGRNVVDFLRKEVDCGRLPETLAPLQSGTGSVANGVFMQLGQGGFRNLCLYTEVLQDACLELIADGVVKKASACSLSLTGAAREKFYRDIEFYKQHITMRPQGITNNPEIIQRLGVVALNTPMEVDIYGNVNSTHVMGSAIMNGIGGSGDFARNSRLNIFAAESVAKGGKISTIVPMVSHVDQTEHDTQIIVTEQGIADLRWKSPTERAECLIENCAHPDYRPMLRAYFEQAKKCAYGQHTPHDLKRALSWHVRYMETGSMKE